jgi:hypothetical protein
MNYISTSAVFSPCDAYRYRLKRTWHARGKVVAFIGLNPSTADATADDPTIRRCVGFAKAWGFGGVAVVNLFAFRATDPRELKRAADPTGPENDAHLLAVATEASKVIAAWGVHGSHRGRDEEVIELLRGTGVRVACLERTNAGHPRHPLYAKGTLRAKALVL